VRRTIIGFIITCALGCLCVAPLAPEAQTPTHVHWIGWLAGTTPERDRNGDVAAFLEGMRALGYVEGQHLVIEYRGAEGQYERFPALAAEVGPSQGGCPDGADYASGPGRQARDYDDPHCDDDRGRSGGERPRRQPRPTWG